MSDYGEKKGHGSLRQNGLRAASLIPDSSLSSIQPAFQPGNPDLLLLNVAGSFENRLFPLVPKLPFGNACFRNSVSRRPSFPSRSLGTRGAEATRCGCGRGAGAASAPVRWG